MSSDCTIKKSTMGATCDARVLNSCLDDQASCTGSPATCSCNFGYTFVSGYCIIVDCPVNTQIPSTRTGVSNAPDVYVGATCYQVDFGTSKTMHCLDTKHQAALQDAKWFKMPGYKAVVKSTGGFINGDTSNTNMTVSNARNDYAGNYICTLCYGSNLTRCTNSSQVQLLVIGAAIQSTSLTVNPSGNIVRGGSLTFTCGTSPAGVATTFTFYKDSNDVQSGPSSTYFISNVQAVHDGSYTCSASNPNSQWTSASYVISAQSTLGQSCINPMRTCGVQYSVCREGTCQCDVGYILNGNVCQILDLGSECANPARTCTTANSVCGPQGTCICASGYSALGFSCVTSMATLGEACTVNVGCQQTATGGTTTNPQCIFGLCACPTGYYTYSNVCFENLWLEFVYLFEKILHKDRGTAVCDKVN